MDDAQRRAHAGMLLSDPVFVEIMDDLERTAINRLLAAPAKDHEGRLAAATEANAIRAVRSRLTALTEQPQKKRAAA